MPPAAAAGPTAVGVLALPPELENGRGGVCNAGDALLASVPKGGRLLWYIRHGESRGNVAKLHALSLDEQEGGTRHFEEYTACSDFVDTPLTERGCGQAAEAARQVATWRVKPTLIVCSPLTRALQTAAVIFERELGDGSARLVVRPELREFFPDNNENQGRPLGELRACPLLRSLRRWPVLSAALDEAATADWREAWDERQAQGSAWREHCGSASRLAAFAAWLAGRSEERIAMVCHWGSINFALNLEPWADGRRREDQQKFASVGGLAKRFEVPNCGWVAVAAAPPPGSHGPGGP